MTFLVCSHFLKQFVNTLEKVSHEINNCAIRLFALLVLVQVLDRPFQLPCFYVFGLTSAELNSGDILITRT